MTKATRWAWIISVVAATGGGLVLVFLLALATNNRALYERYYLWLFWLNVAVATMLVLVIGIASLRLLVRVRRGKFGSRLLLKLAGIFAFVGVIPGLLIYTVSYQFVSRSIETWFDVRVEGALDAGLNLGRGTLDSVVTDLAAKTRLAAERMGDQPGAPQPVALERLREQFSARDIAVVGPNGQTLLSAGRPGAALTAERPMPNLLKQARSAGIVAQLEGLEDDTAAPGSPPGARVRALAYIPSQNFSLATEDRFLWVTQELPPSLAANALAVQSAYREYQQRALARDGLRRMYIGTLTLTLILAVFGAVLLAALLGKQLARPLLLLAEGMRQVAQGDLTPKPVFSSRDELGGLTRSFADMTEQLSDARSLVQRSLSQLERARTDLQTILDNLTAGVIVFDREGRIETVNPGATRIMRLPMSAYIGRLLNDVPGLEAFAKAVGERYELHADSPEPGERDLWQESFDVQTQASRDNVTLLVRGAPLPAGARLMVFDDITELVSAQRSEAWSEVARRLAHEIKNPLTPIQLSAERIEHKLAPKLTGADQAMLQRSVATIVNQVHSMKQLVNEFRDYARLPSARLTPLDLNALVGEVLALYANEQESGRLRADTSPDLPLIVGDATQLRQVIHNLVQNGLDAVSEQEDGHVCVHTEVTRNEQHEPRSVRLHVIDNGHGFPEKVLKRAFEPYVTTKTKGTGLGLAVVKKIADEHGARVRISNLPPAAPPASPQQGDSTASNALAEAAVAASHEGGQGAVHGGAQVSLSFSKLATVEASNQEATQKHAGTH